MNKPQNFLVALLAVQVLLTAGLYARGRQLETRQGQSAAVLSFKKDNVDKLVLSDKDKKVTLNKAANGWQMPDMQGLSADRAKVEGLLTTLSELKGGWPVATTESSHEQFEVADKKYSRKIEVFSGDKPVAELYVGTSPGFRKTHVRAAKDVNVYAADLNLMDIPLENDQWFDHSLLQAKDPTEIKGADFTLKKSGADWKLDGTGVLNATNAIGLAKTLTDLRVDSLKATAPVGLPALTFEVIDGGKPLSYQFWSDQTSATLKRSDSDKSFGLAKPTYDLLASYTRAKLTEKAPESTSGKPSKSATPGSAAAATPGVSASASPKATQ